MKLYKLTCMDSSDGACIRWASTKSLARLAKDEMLSDHDTESVNVQRIDFPTKQAEVVSWLNVHLNRDNG